MDALHVKELRFARSPVRSFVLRSGSVWSRSGCNGAGEEHLVASLSRVWYIATSRVWCV